MEQNKQKEENKKPTDKGTGKGTGMRYNKGKLRYDLVHPEAHRDMVDVLTYGAEKYTIRDENGVVTYDGSMNWRDGLSWSSVLASLKRHVAAIDIGEDYDPETGKLHAAHAACNIHFLNAFYYIFPQGDDRPKNFKRIPKIGLDIDGVIADFNKAWIRKYPDLPENPATFHYDRKMVERINEMRDKNELDDFYLSFDPLFHADSLPFVPECYITSRPVDTKITEQWLDAHGFPARPVFTVPMRTSKVEVAKEQGIEIFIDDSFDNFVDLNKHGIFTYLYTASYNRKHQVGHMRLNSLNDLPFLK